MPSIQRPFSKHIYIYLKKAITKNNASNKQNILATIFAILLKIYLHSRKQSFQPHEILWSLFLWPECSGGKIYYRFYMFQHNAENLSESEKLVLEYVDMGYTNGVVYVVMVYGVYLFRKKKYIKMKMKQVF